MENLVTEFMKIKKIKLNYSFNFKSGAPSHRFINCLMSIDGTYCPTMEPNGFDPTFYSRKLQCAALGYKVGLQLDGIKLVWINGAFKVAPNPDINLFQCELKTFLSSNEFVVSDVCSNNYKCVQLNLLSNSFNKETHRNILARQEKLNGLLKRVNVSCQKFKHKRCLPSECFHAVAHIVQLNISLKRIERCVLGINTD